MRVPYFLLAAAATLLPDAARAEIFHIYAGGVFDYFAYVPGKSTNPNDPNFHTLKYVDSGGPPPPDFTTTRC